MNKGDWIQEMTELFADHGYAYGNYAYQLACAYWDDGSETPIEALCRFIEINTEVTKYE